jgi:hypothetical protein
VQIVPTNQRHDLTDLVGLRLTLLRLQIQEFADASSGKDSMASSAADLSKAERYDEPDQVTEVDVADIAPTQALEEPRGLHVGEGNDGV